MVCLNLTQLYPNMVLFSNSHTSAESVRAAMDAWIYDCGMTNTQQGILIMREIMARALIDRPSIPKLVFVLTDGMSNVQPELTVPNANDLKVGWLTMYHLAPLNTKRGVSEIEPIR